MFYTTTKVYVLKTKWDPYYGYRIHQAGDVAFITHHSDSTGADIRVVKTSKEGVLPGWGMRITEHELNKYFTLWDGR